LWNAASHKPLFQQVPQKIQSLPPLWGKPQSIPKMRMIPGRCLCRQIGLRQNVDDRPLPFAVEQRPILIGEFRRRINEQHKQIGSLNGPLRSLNALRLDNIIGLAKAGRVDQSDRNARQGDFSFDRVPSGSGNRRHNRSVLGKERVEQRGLSGVGPPDQGNHEPLTKDPTEISLIVQIRQLLKNLFERRFRLPCVRIRLEIDVGIVNPHFQRSDNRLNPSADLIHLVGEPSPKLPDGDLQTKTCSGMNHIGYALRLIERDPAVLERALCEFPSFGKPRPLPEDQLKNPPDCRHSSMRMDFNDIFPRVRARCPHERYEHLIDVGHLIPNHPIVDGV